jgi:hypothetical protein
MKCNFTYRHYEEILKIAKGEAFEFSSFSLEPDSRKRIYLRHDIDISIRNALDIAEIEKNNQVASTFFIQLNSPFYNIFEEGSLEIIRGIISLGHYIGIHFDIQLIPDHNALNLEEPIYRQYAFLRDFFPLQKVVSFHHPSQKVLNSEIDCGAFVNTYSPQFRQRYLSDSNGSWKEGCPCRILKEAGLENVQILTHPFWWNRDEPGGLSNRYLRFLASNEEKMRRDFRRTCHGFREILEG